MTLTLTDPLGTLPSLNLNQFSKKNSGTYTRNQVNLSLDGFNLDQQPIYSGERLQRYLWTFKLLLDPDDWLILDTYVKLRKVRAYYVFEDLVEEVTPFPTGVPDRAIISGTLRTTFTGYQTGKSKFPVSIDLVDEGDKEGSKDGVRLCKAPTILLYELRGVTLP